MNELLGKYLHMETRSSGVAVLTVDVLDRPHNVLNQQVMLELGEAIEQVAARKDIHLLVIRSGKDSGFFAGADLHEFKDIQTAADAKAISARGQRLFDKLAQLHVPTAVIIHGVCLGGGLELALACDYRIVVDHPTTSIGLPEVRLGILPGWGGTQRLPRVIGIERAIQMILQGKQLAAADAQRWGLAVHVAESNEGAMEFVEKQLLERARREGKPARKCMAARSWRQRLLEANPLGRWLLFRGADRIARQKVPDDMPGPFDALKAIQVGTSRGMSAGLAYEREAIGRLAVTSACRNLVTLFFLNENARKGSEENGDDQRTIKTVAVVGAGTMGAGIAQLAAVKGFKVIVQEVNDAALNAGVQKIESLLQKMVDRGRMTADAMRAKLAGIGKTTSFQGFESADLVIEAVVEDLNLKRKVFHELEHRVRPDAILATNTSSLSVARIQEGMTRPERIAGLHFFNPVHKMLLIEVIWAAGTDQSLMPTLARFAAALGKTPVIIRDSTGFLVNRILFPYLNEAGLLVAEGMPVQEVDRVARRFGMMMGPLRLLDEIGLDVAAHVATTVAPVFGARLTPHPGLNQMVQNGWLGKKSGAGFYVYGGKSRSEVNTEAKNLMLNGSDGSAADPEEARERMVLLTVNEAAACLGEGLAASADVIDLAMVLGTGWAPHRGGPLRYVDQRGAADIVHKLDTLKNTHGPRFTPCEELRRRERSGKKFYEFLEKLVSAPA